MKNFYSMLDKKSMLNINLVSLTITAICEIFVLMLLFSKIENGETEGWKFKAMVIGVVVVSFLFLLSLASLVYFISIKGNK